MHINSEKIVFGACLSLVTNINLILHVIIGSVCSIVFIANHFKAKYTNVNNKM